jgi:hypothetical protein
MVARNLKRGLTRPRFLEATAGTVVAGSLLSFSWRRLKKLHRAGSMSSTKQPITSTVRSTILSGWNSWRLDLPQWYP